MWQLQQQYTLKFKKYLISATLNYSEAEFWVKIERDQIWKISQKVEEFTLLLNSTSPWLWQHLYTLFCWTSKNLEMTVRFYWHPVVFSKKKISTFQLFHSHLGMANSRYDSIFTVENKIQKRWVPICQTFNI